MVARKHTVQTYKFETEADAQSFIEKHLGKYPNEDKYIRGPIFMDEDKIFKHMIWASTGKKWWQVTVEIFK